MFKPRLVRLADRDTAQGPTFEAQAPSFAGPSLQLTHTNHTHFGIPHFNWPTEHLSAPLLQNDWLATRYPYVALLSKLRGYISKRTAGTFPLLLLCCCLAPSPPQSQQGIPSRSTQDVAIRQHVGSIAGVTHGLFDVIWDHPCTNICMYKF